MKYRNETVVEAQYDNLQGNPFLEALPELMGKTEFMERVKGEISCPHNLQGRKAQERRNSLNEILCWFYPMDYMYRIYDMLYRFIQSTYKTKSTIEVIRQMQVLYEGYVSKRSYSQGFATQTACGAILGVPGIGKSSTIQRCLGLIPQVIVHKNYDGRPFYTKQIPYLFIECPSDCSVKTLGLNILSAIDRAIGSNYLEAGMSSRALSASALTTRLKIICMNHHIGVIVIDEIQNVMYTASNNKQVKPLVKFLVELSNETATSICYCGTLDADDLFLQQEHLKRRTRGLRLFPLKYDGSFRRFITALWEYQVILNPSELTERLMRQVYDLSGGIPAYIIKLFQEAQSQAILSGREVLDYDTFKEAAQLLSIKTPKYYGQSGTSISDFEVVDSDFLELRRQVEAMENTRADNMIEEDEATLEATDIPVESMTGSFYAVKRGRKANVRESADIIEAWKQDPNNLLVALESLGVVERRCVQ